MPIGVVVAIVNLGIIAVVVLCGALIDAAEGRHEATKE